MAEDNVDLDLVLEVNHKPIVCPATAVYIKTESGDTYLYNFSTHLSQEKALRKAELVCPEVFEYWAEHLVSWTSLDLENQVNTKIKNTGE